MTVIENIDVVMGAKTADLDKAIAKEVKALKQLDKESSKGGGFDAKSRFDLPFGMSKSFAATAVAAGSVAYEIAQITKQMAEIDKTSDAAKRLGTSFSDLKVLQLGLAESSGLGVDEINAAIQKMQVNLVDASKDPNSDVAKQLGGVGLDPKKLLAEGSLEAFRELSTVISGIGSQAEQLAFTTSVFGKSGGALVQSLRDGPGQINEMADFAKKFGLSLSDAQAEMVGLANDSVGRLSSAFDGVYMQLSAEISPVITVIASEMLGVVGSSDDWNASLKLTTDFVASTYGLVKDMGQAITSTGAALGSLSLGDTQVAAMQWKDAMTFDQGVNAMIAVDNIRKAARDAADETRRKREAQREHNSLLDKELDSQRKILDEISRQVGQKRDMLGSVSDEVAKLQASNQAALNGEKFDSKAFDEKQKLEKLGKSGFDLQLERQQRLRKEEEAIAEAIKESADLKDKFKTGDQRLVEEIRKLEDLKRAGLIDQTLVEKARQEAEQATAPADARQGAVSVQQGSVAAYKLLVERDNELTKTAKSQERIAQATLEVMQETRDGIKNIKPIKAAR